MAYGSLVLSNSMTKEFDPVKMPKEGMVCLAQFSKDGCFYRAKVVDVCSKGRYYFLMLEIMD